MADAADEACPHMVTGLHPNEGTRYLEWSCADCGRVFSSLAMSSAESGQFLIWATKMRIPQMTVVRAVRRGAVPAVAVGTKDPEHWEWR